GAVCYPEVVLTGIHLSSFGRDLQGETLLDAVRVVAQAPGIHRVRLGSLEPVIATRAFAQALAELPQVCPQFHLSLQSGSDAVLKRMRRRYTAAEFMQAADHLRQAFPGCALTTDIIAGFPGETDEEHQETLAFVRRVGFARLHVFPFSPRQDTPAATMPGQLPKAGKDARARELIALGDELADGYRRTLLHTTQPVLFEESGDGGATGYTPQYIEVFAPGAVSGQLADVTIDSVDGQRLVGRLTASVSP
ncbi:MAG: radical SAM protein, partial [Corynebacterium humireducens]|nr:radical SAM protein [Corynebacterium humireducens]